MLKKYIGTKEFYKMVFVLLVPMIVQQGITQFVNLLDNVMVGSLGTEPMTGVAIINQLFFVFNITIFGSISGACIYGAQYYGNKDYDGVRYTFRFKIIISIVICTASIVIFAIYGENLIKLFLNGEKSVEQIGNVELTLSEARAYLNIMLIGLPAFVVSQCYSTTLRENGETRLPMYASTLAIVVNLTLNAILIFGLFGFPALGVRGAAIATVIARYGETGFLVYRTHANAYRFEFINKVYTSFKIPFEVVKKIIITGWPLFANEFMWSLGMATITQNYSIRGLGVMAGLNIASTIYNLFMVAMFAMGGAISIIVGQELGAGNIEEAKDKDRKLIFFNVGMYIVIGIVLILLSPFIPLAYKTENSVRQLATQFLIVYAISLPLHAFNHSTYFTMRSGGKTFITFLFDSVFVWVVSLPLAYYLSKYTNIYIVYVYAIVIFSDIIKAVIGAILLKSGVWAKNIIK